MFRCIVTEVFSLGGGHALRGDYSRAAAWAGAVVVCVALALWTPWAVLLMTPLRIASIIDAGRAGMPVPVFPISSVRARIVGIWLGSRVGAID